MIKNAIKAAIALLKKSAQDLADGVSINGVPQWADEPATQDAHNHELDVIAKLDASLTHVGIIEAELISVKHLWVENAAHLARIALLESQLADETERLDFVLNEELVIYEFREKFRLNNAMGEMPFPGVFESPRAAIDAAIGLAKGGA